MKAVEYWTNKRTTVLSILFSAFSIIGWAFYNTSSSGLILILALVFFFMLYKAMFVICLWTYDMMKAKCVSSTRERGVSFFCLRGMFCLTF